MYRYQAVKNILMNSQIANMKELEINSSFYMYIIYIYISC